ncbi:helix-turn-helix domain-containing protein [Rhodococcus sp. NPDC058521]|uniref:helix-turn-helix domain-containing protein n=1 Tax=Rhodococcus sp. NPDC058521 TaxID=3346536 RepID=UPI003667C0E4
MVGSGEIVGWNPSICGIEEVFHAHLVDHTYPKHTHECWTLLIVDSGVIRYDLDGHEHGSMDSLVTLLPPHVPHDGRSVGVDGFRKRVLYLEPELLSGVGAAVDMPSLQDPVLRDRVHRLHSSLIRPGDEFEAQCRLEIVRERLQGHLLREVGTPPSYCDPSLARMLRDLIDSRTQLGVTLGEASELLHADSTHLVRSFSREFGIAPHQYLIGRRIELARRLLLAGHRPSQAAAAAGFHDQAHLNRHFKRMVGTTPARFARWRP